MNQVVAEHIKDYLKQQHREGKEYVMGGHIEDYMRTRLGTKGETTSRICRFMVKWGQIEPVYVPRKKGKANVAYKLKDKNGIMSASEEEKRTNASTESREATQEVCRNSETQGKGVGRLQVRTLW
jgi:hypothetical protein